MTSFLCTLRSISARLLSTDLARRQGALAGPRAQRFTKQHHYDFFTLLSIFHDHLDDDYEQDSGTQVMFSSKVDEEDLRGSGSFPLFISVR